MPATRTYRTDREPDGAAAWRLVLARQCPKHAQARPGRPCYDLPTALCGARIEAVTR